MLEYCQSQGIGLLCYGTVAGGWLSERWLNQPEPNELLPNRSLTKYRLIIDDFGGWGRFQSLLTALSVIAQKHGSDIASIATRTILDRLEVAAAIVGATNVSHLSSHQQIGLIKLDPEDHTLLRSVLQPRVGPLGEVYALERNRTGKHGQIMKYNLTQIQA